MISIACVRAGDKYPPEYVARLKSMALRHAPAGARFACLTDRPGELPAGIEAIDVGALRLPGWWAKMALFSPRWRPSGRCLYFDLDTIICGDLAPLADLDLKFGICWNFARAAGALKWPCLFGSCVLTFRDGWGQEIFDRFAADGAAIMRACGRYGDQMAIQKLIPHAAILQNYLPPDFFLNKRDFAGGPGGASVLIFGGKHRPDNTPHEWVKELWK